MATEKPVLIARSRDRMPNHLFYATVRHFDKKNAVARKVLCELYLPDSQGRNRDHFSPDSRTDSSFSVCSRRFAVCQVAACTFRAQIRRNLARRGADRDAGWHFIYVLLQGARLES